MSQKPSLDDERKFVIKTYTKGELRMRYNVGATTFGKWIKKIILDHPDVFPPEKGLKFRIFTPAQVAKIVEVLGMP